MHFKFIGFRKKWWCVRSRECFWWQCSGQQRSQCIWMQRRVIHWFGMLIINEVLIVCNYSLLHLLPLKWILLCFLCPWNDDLFFNLKKKWKKYIFKLFNFQQISEETGKNHFNVFTQTSLNQCVSHWMFSNYMPGYIHILNSSLCKHKSFKIEFLFDRNIRVSWFKHVQRPEK